MTRKARFEDFDDLRVISGDPDRAFRFTVTGLIRNEMHFLPVFLPHYRTLGVDRFIFIDDASDDGTHDYLAEQPDVTVLQSTRRFGDRVDFGYGSDGQPTKMRIPNIWRTLLLRKFCVDKWSIHVDADEFVDLPQGMTLRDVCKVMDGSQHRSVWSVMLDMYPATIKALMDMQTDPQIDLTKDWYFDGSRHLQLRSRHKPKIVYAGSRARLLLDHGLHPKAGLFDRIIRPTLGMGPPRYNAIFKQILFRWQPQDRFKSSHTVTAPASDRMLVPMRHYKFNGAIAQRIAWAKQSGSYSGGSAEYHALADLLCRMKDQNASFLGPRSRLYRSCDDFRQTGNAQGLS